MTANRHPGTEGLAAMTFALGLSRTYALASLLSLPSADMTPPRPLQRLDIHAQAAPNLNPDAAGSALPVVVCIYQLKDRLEFSKLTFDQAASGRPEAEFLGPECLGRREVILAPDSACDATEELLPGLRYVGIVALFRSPDEGHWRCLARLEPPSPPPAAPKRSWLKRAFSKPPRPEPPPRNLALSFTLEACRVHLVSPQAEPIPAPMGPAR